MLIEKKKINSQYKILAVTGRSAENLVRNYLPKNVELKVLPINVAAFITQELILENISREFAKKFDIIIVPGLVQGNTSSLKDSLEIPVVKGPKYASDIGMTLSELDVFELSTIYPADQHLRSKKFEETKKLLNDGFTKPINKKINEFSIGSLYTFPVGITRPPLIMAEIVDATKLSLEKVKERASYYLKHGADILDIGAVANKPQPDKIVKIINELKQLQDKNKFAISVDTLNVEEIEAAIKAKVDLILSIDHGNIAHLGPKIPKDVGVVIIPTNISEGFMPRKPADRVDSLIQLQKKLKEFGLTKIVADPIIEMPVYPGFINSLRGYIDFREHDAQTPMMTCIGNVTEFIAADAVGINVLFNTIAVELGIQFLLATDVSVKCRGGVSEIVKGRNLAYAAKCRNAPPKGHGINVLLAKSRTANDLDIQIPTKVETIKLESQDKELYSLEIERDPKGNFIIWTDYHKQLIFIIHLDPKTNEPTILLKARNARLLFDEIMKRGLVTKLSHAFYLGRELERAEVCLYLGKTYIQNEQTFQD
ncbi:MAG: dihydropteroate synthase-like protein [Candidatus Heimdallarchaeota archaeon]